MFQICQACAANCLVCNTNGAGQCDAGMCAEGYGLTASGNLCQACADHCSACTQAGKCNSDACDGRYVFVTATATCAGKFIDGKIFIDHCRLKKKGTLTHGMDYMC